jgi:hypothetical protein
MKYRVSFLMDERENIEKKITLVENKRPQIGINISFLLRKSSIEEQLF